jgi:hypothetical protein
LVLKAPARKDGLPGVRDNLIIKDYRYAREELERVQTMR